MITNIIFYSSLPGLVCLFCVFLAVKQLTKRAGQPFVVLICNVAAINLLQSVAFLVFNHSRPIAEYLADAYLICLYYLFACLVNLSIYLSAYTRLKRYARGVFLIPHALMVLHIMGFMTAGYRVEHNSLMHNDGPLHFLFDGFILLSCLFFIVVSLLNCKSKEASRMLISRNIIALVSFIPLALSFSVLIILSLTDFAVPVVVVIPLATFYMSIVFYYTSREKVVNIAIGLRAFLARCKIALELIQNDKSKDLVKRYTAAIEKQFIIEALKETGNKAIPAAELLGYEKSTVRNKMKKYGIADSAA